MVTKVNYDFDLLSSSVSISEASPTGIINNKTGKPMGSLEKLPNGEKQAVRVQLNKIRYMVHRVIWVLHYGSIDSNLDIDHIDGNPHNNRLSNLRMVEKTINQRNRKKMKNNQTGYNGVCIHINSKQTYVRAVWVNLKGKQEHKDFNIKNFETLEFATEFADLYRQLQIQDIETYTERHGQ